MQPAGHERQHYQHVESILCRAFLKLFQNWSKTLHDDTYLLFSVQSGLVREYLDDISIQLQFSLELFLCVSETQ